MTPRKPKIALWFRYGPAEHTELFHAMPDIVVELAKHFEVHYYGLGSPKPVPLQIEQNAVVHTLPFSVDRTSGRDKAWKTILWLFCLPFVGLQCRLSGVRAVYIDETVPLTAGLARVFFGPRVAFTVADFFPEIYFGRSPWLKPFVRPLRTLDLWAWRRLGVVFTRAKTTRAYLTERGVPFEAIHPVYDPCDFTIYHPANRQEPRDRFGYAPDNIVLVHHGILHPNKGNDRILRALAESRSAIPQLRYLLVGDGPERGALERLVADLRLDNIVQFTGWLPTLSEVNAALNMADIGLVMRTGQRSDGFHMTGALVHSMACGLPVLAARLGGVSEIIQEDDAGLLFDPNDMAEFKGKLFRLSMDASLRDRLGRRALDLARQHFDIRRVTEQTVQPLLMLAGTTPS